MKQRMKRKQKISNLKFNSPKINKQKINKSVIRRQKIGGHCILMDQQEDKRQEQGFGLQVQVMKVSSFPTN